MPKIRLMAWNIQNFGSDTISYALYKGDNSSFLANFIAGVIRTYNIDVCVIMEVSQSARASLNSVLAALNNGLNPKPWCYDWIAGCVKESRNVTAPQNINSPDDLAWRGSYVSYRSEGYAVFWRNDRQGDAFKMLRAEQNMSQGVRKDNTYNPNYVPTHCISLSLRGRDYRHIKPPPYVQAERGWVQSQPGSNWTDSAYPDVSRYVNPYIPLWQRVRRPAWVAIQIVAGGGQANTVIPFVVYHAPSTRQISRPGTYINGMAQELYVLKTVNNNTPNGALFYHSKAVAAGDYNLDVRADDNWNSSYRTFFRPFGINVHDFDSGANMLALSSNTDWVRTTVQLKQFVNGTPTGPQIQDNNLNNYYHSVIDNLFYRGLANPQLFICLLPQAVMGNNELTGGLVSNFFNHVDRWRAIAVQRHGDVHPMFGPRLPIIRRGVTTLEPQFKNMINWQYFIAGLQQGSFTGNWDSQTGGARSAAMFIHDFISDHLPVFVEFDVA